MSKKEIRKFILPMIFVMISLVLVLFYIWVKSEKEKEDYEDGVLFEDELGEYLDSTYGFYFNVKLSNNKIFNDYICSLYPSGSLFLNGYIGEQSCYFKIYPGGDTTNEDQSTEVIILESGTFISTKNFENITGETPAIDTDYIWMEGGANGSAIKENLLSNISNADKDRAVTDQGDSAFTASFTYKFLSPVFVSVKDTVDAYIRTEGDTPNRKCSISFMGKQTNIDVIMSEVTKVYVTKTPTRYVKSEIYLSKK